MSPDATMAWLEDLRREHGLDAWTRDGLNVFEAARYETLAELGNRKPLKEELWPIVERTALVARAHLRRRPAPAHQPVVFTDYFPNNHGCLQPIADELARRGIGSTWLAPRRSVQAAVPGSILLDDLLPLRVLTAPLHRGKLGRLPPSAARALTRAGARAASWLAAYDAAFATLRPRVVVTAMYSALPGRAAALAAAKHGARSVYVQHGLFPDRYVYSFFLEDKKLVWGEHERDLLVRHGHAPASLIPVGATPYDELGRLPPRPWPEKTLEIALMASRTAGAFVNEAVARRTIAAAAEAARAVGGRLTVKAHPGDATRVPEEACAAFPEVRLVRVGRSSDVVAASDVVLIVSSTTGYEACVAGRPLVVFNLTGQDDWSEFARLGAALSVTREADLAPALRRLAEPAVRADLAAGRRRFLDRMLGGATGDAAARAATAIAELIP